MIERAGKEKEFYNRNRKLVSPATERKVASLADRKVYYQLSPQVKVRDAYALLALPFLSTAVRINLDKPKASHLARQLPIRVGQFIEF